MWISVAHLDIRASTVILVIFIIENEFLISVEQELLTLPEHLNSSHVLCVVCVAHSLGSCVVFLDHCLVFFVAIMLSIPLRFTFSDCPLVAFLVVSYHIKTCHIQWAAHIRGIKKSREYMENKIKVPRNYAVWQYYIKLICMWFWQNNVRKVWAYQRVIRSRKSRKGRQHNDHKIPKSNQKP